MKYLQLTIIAVLGLVAFASCNKDDDSATVTPTLTPLREGTNITMRNTLQDSGQAEVTYPSLFSQPDSAWDESGTLSNATSEFPTALSQSPATGAPFPISGLYDIDLTENSVSYTVLPDTTDPFWSNVFGLFPAGKVDRYYMTFSQPHNVTGFSSNESWVNVRIDSDTVIVVELSEGYDLQPGVSFSLSLK